MAFLVSQRCHVFEELLCNMFSYAKAIANCIQINLQQKIMQFRQEMHEI